MRRAIVMLLMFAGACADKHEGRCALDSDCFRGEVCNEGFCGDPILTIDDTDMGRDAAAVTAVDMSTSTSVDIGVVDMPRPTDDIGTPVDDGSPDMSTSPTVDSSTGLCKVNPFTTMCAADDNDNFSESIPIDGRGCMTFGDGFEPSTTTLLDEAICPLEAADKFTTILVPCNDSTFVVQVTVTPHQPCDPDDWEFDMRVQGNDCADGNGMMQCETLPDGSKRAIGFVSPSVSLTSVFITITPVAENLQFDYDLELVVRE